MQTVVDIFLLFDKRFKFAALNLLNSLKEWRFGNSSSRDLNDSNFREKFFHDSRELA